MRNGARIQRRGTHPFRRRRCNFTDVAAVISYIYRFWDSRGATFSRRRGVCAQVRTRGWVSKLRWIGTAAVAAALWGTSFPLPGMQVASADREPLRIVVEAGYGGSMTEGEWFPVKATVTNPGDDVSGELAIHFAENGSDAVFAKALDLPSQSAKVVWFALPGKPLHLNNNRIAFHERGVGRGPEIPFSQGKVSVETAASPPHALTIGVAARDPDTLNFLTLLNQKGYQVDVIRLAIDEFPWDAAMLDGLDAVAFNDAATDALSQEQVEELQAWVGQGGRLILAGGAGFAKTAAAFEALSPVEATGMTTVSALPSFERAAGLELPLNGPLSVTAAGVKEGETLFAESGVPLVVSRSFGSGVVVYVAYDLASQPLASWSGNAALWERILSDALHVNAPGSGGPMYFNSSWEFDRALETFPQFVPPNYRMLVLLFLAYAIVVAPLLYFVLKKLDRREWGWVAIPAVAILASALIYGIGASGRGSTLAQSLSIYELDGGGAAVRTTGASVFVPSGGEYTLSWEGERQVAPFRVNYGGGSIQDRTETIVRSEADRTTATFRNVPFWSVRKAYTAAERVEAAGSFEYTMRYDAGAIAGEVVNGTNRDLYDAWALHGGRWVRIGDLAKGERREFRLSTGGGPAVIPPNAGDRAFPNTGRSDEKQRERALLNAFAESRWNGGIVGQDAEPMLIGFAKAEEASFAIDGMAVNATQIELYVQPMRFEFEHDGRIAIPGGFIVPSTENSGISYMNHYGNGEIEIGAGELVLVYRLPQDEGWTYEKAALTNVPTSFKFELWTGGSWEPIDAASVELTGERLAESITEEGTLRVKLIAGQNGMLDYPALSAEGTVRP